MVGSATCMHASDGSITNSTATSGAGGDGNGGDGAGGIGWIQVYGGTTSVANGTLDRW